MTVPDDLVKAADNAPCLHAPHLTCDPDQEMVHPECAVAAVLRALLASEALRDAIGPNPDFDRGWSACRAAIAQLADE